MHKLLACVECDLVIKVPDKVESGTVLLCPRCEHYVLGAKDNVETVTLALSCTALIMLLIAVCLPFLGFNAEGQTGSISVLEASLELFDSGSYLLAVLVMFLIVLLPACYFIMLLMLLGSVKFHYFKYSRVILARMIVLILPWLMADVFLIGVLVALIKLLGMAQVIFGVSFWAYIAFTILYLKTSKLVDNHQLWDWVDDSKSSDQRYEL